MNPIRLVLSLVASWTLGVGCAHAFEPQADAPPAEERLLPYSGALPPCDYPGVAARIMGDFAARESEYWSSGLQIAEIVDMRETGYRKHGLSYIPRRYCEAHALLNTGERRRVAYEIGEDLGFIGVGFGVSWRVQGLDRQRETAFGRLSR